MDVLERIARIEQEALAAIRAAQTLEEVALAAAGVDEGTEQAPGLKQILRTIGRLPKDQRGPVGKGANDARKAVTNAAQARRAQLVEAAEADLGATEWVDATLPPGPRHGLRRQGGTLHPVSALVREMEEIFLSLGFEALDGPWAEDEHHNFNALNMPADHPARDMQDTYWLDGGSLLRTHTSPVQIRAMEAKPPPIRAVCLGRVFRHEELDATHENTFHQVEGFYVDREVSVGHMLYVLRTLLREILDEDVQVRLRPSYFPFVEPGFEMDVTFRGDWMELLGCGLVHPHVLEAGGIDPAAWSGFAFGLGIDRLVMLKHDVEDIRHFMSGDLRFLRQFESGVEG